MEGYGQPRCPRYFAQIGLDYVFLDTEHTPIDRETLAWAVQVYVASGIAPLIRIPSIDTSLAAQALDLGAHGVVVPYLETVSQVNDMVGAVKYRPLKGIALDEVLNQVNSLSSETVGYLADYNQDAILWIMIESLAGADQLDAMLSLRDVDGVLIGPHDLSISCGVPEGYEHPKFIETVERIVTTCQQHHTSVGIHVSWGDLEYEISWIGKGCNIILHSSDTFCFASNMAKELNIIKEQSGYLERSSIVVNGRKGHAM